MKGHKTYSLLHLSKQYKIPKKTLDSRCRVAGFKKTITGSKQPIYLLNEDEAGLIIAKSGQKMIVIPEIIYVHTTWIVLESKINFQ